MAAQAAGGLGTAAGFAVLADGTGLTCTDSTITGPVGVSSSSTAITSTRCHMQTQVAAGAYADFRTLYTGIAANLTPCTTLSGTLAGQSLASGVYCFPAAAALTGTLTLTGSGPWLIEIGTQAVGALTATGFTVVGGSPCNAMWWVHNDVTLSTSTFQGTILGGGDITLTDTALTGRVLATGAVTMTRSPILGCTAAGTVPGTCNKGEGSDQDKNGDQSKDASDKKVESAKDAEHGDKSDKSDKKDKTDKAPKGCDSNESNEGKDNESKD